MTETEEPLQVLLADDHPMFREGLAAVLSTDPRIEIVAEASTGETAVALASSHQPDVVVMDVNMPGLNGIEATRRIVTESPHIGVLVLTMFDEDENVFQAMRVGARGYLLKGADREREVLEQLARRRTNGEIARLLNISVKTVRNHVSNVFAKLQVSDRAQAIIRAREAGLGNH